MCVCVGGWGGGFRQMVYPKEKTPGQLALKREESGMQTFQTVAVKLFKGPQKLTALTLCLTKRQKEGTIT